RFTVLDLDTATGRAITIRVNAVADKYRKAKTMSNQGDGAVTGGTVITPQMVSLTFSDAAQDVLNEYKANGRQSVEHVQRYLRLHLLPFFARRRMSAITAVDVRRYIMMRQSQRASNATVNRELAVLRRAFSLAVAAGSLTARPHIPMLREDNVRKGFFEEAQFTSVRGH